MTRGFLIVRQRELDFVPPFCLLQNLTIYTVLPNGLTCVVLHHVVVVSVGGLCEVHPHGPHAHGRVPPPKQTELGTRVHPAAPTHTLHYTHKRRGIGKKRTKETRKRKRKMKVLVIGKVFFSSLTPSRLYDGSDHPGYFLHIGRAFWTACIGPPATLCGQAWVRGWDGRGGERGRGGGGVLTHCTRLRTVWFGFLVGCQRVNLAH